MGNKCPLVEQPREHRRDQVFSIRASFRNPGVLDFDREVVLPTIIDRGVGNPGGTDLSGHQNTGAVKAQTCCGYPPPRKIAIIPISKGAVERES